MTRRTFYLRSLHSRRGITFIEILVAALIMAVGLISLMSVWAFSFTITQNSDEVGIAYNLARQEIERQHAWGYFYANDASSPAYYDANENNVGGPQGAYYRVSTIIKTGSDSPNPQGNLREVEVIVTRVSDGKELARTQTYLTQGGI